jgi:UDP-N-acetylmuramoylalanine--D-glutamate ligase
MENNKVKSLKAQVLEARKKSMSLFSDIGHRLESVVVKNDVEWINDSKATDIDSSYYSLELMDKPVIWIVGASDVERDYSVFDKLVRYKVKKIICFGSYETQIKYTFAGITEGYAHKDTLNEAMVIAQEWTKEGDVVLFSPACSSFDLYDDYKQRGEHFKSLIPNI